MLSGVWTLSAVAGRIQLEREAVRANWREKSMVPIRGWCCELSFVDCVWTRRRDFRSLVYIPWKGNLRGVVPTSDVFSKPLTGRPLASMLWGCRRPISLVVVTFPLISNSGGFWKRLCFGWFDNAGFCGWNGPGPGRVWDGRKRVDFGWQISFMQYT